MLIVVNDWLSCYVALRTRNKECKWTSIKCSQAQCRDKSCAMSQTIVEGALNMVPLCRDWVGGITLGRQWESRGQDYGQYMKSYILLVSTDDSSPVRILVNPGGLSWTRMAVGEYNDWGPNSVESVWIWTYYLNKITLDLLFCMKCNQHFIYIVGLIQKSPKYVLSSCLCATTHPITNCCSNSLCSVFRFLTQCLSLMLWSMPCLLAIPWSLSLSTCGFDARAPQSIDMYAYMCMLHILQEA